jgi:Leucine-rich repeat (LRR) protein
MKISKLCLVTVSLLIFAGQARSQAKPDPAKHEQKVKDMVAFLEYVLNTIGAKGTSSRDKDVLITESYTKIFRDGKVQVEDDLDENRKVITNKDVQAYLKDVDFFFDDVKFELKINDIKGKLNANGKLFYKVSLTRNLKGTTVEGKAVNKTIPRNVEINYDPQDQDLKIVSVYTHEFDEEEALTNWWNSLSFEWQSIFEKKLNLTDSVQLDDIQNIIAIEELDLSGNQYIQTIEPLGQLTSLRVLNVSGTSIRDLSPIRNLTELVELDVSRTSIEDLASLRYAEKLKRFDISHTTVTDISVLEKMVALEYLDMSTTGVTDLAPLGTLTALKHLRLESTGIKDLAMITPLAALAELNLSKTMVSDLKPLKGLSQLAVLYLDSTQVSDLSPLSNLTNLQVLSVNNTAVADLDPLKANTRLEKIYCDQTPINRPLADAFMAARPGVLVIFNSADLRGWWDGLPVAWQTVLSGAAGTGPDPTKEDLAKVTNLDSVNLSGNVLIRDIEPLRRLRKLQVMVATKTAIQDLSPLNEHREVRALYINDTPVEDLATLARFTKLRMLQVERTRIRNIEPLLGISALKKLYADGTIVDDQQVREFLTKNPGCLVVYKTDSLESWWDGLPENWKEVFRTQTSVNMRSRKEDLHRLVELEALHFDNISVNELSWLSPFVRLKELHFSGTAITDLAPLMTLSSLRSLHATNSPVGNLGPLSRLTALEDLDISNTPVADLRPLSPLQNLKKLNCSGTPVKKIDALERLESLEYFDCSNTGVKSLEAVQRLPLKTLKCYNTDIPKKRVDQFKDKHPDCNVVYY